MKKSNVVLASVASDAAATLAEFLNFQPAVFFLLFFSVMRFHIQLNKNICCDVISFIALKMHKQLYGHKTIHLFSNKSINRTINVKPFLQRFQHSAFSTRWIQFYSTQAAGISPVLVEL